MLMKALGRAHHFEAQVTKESMIANVRVEKFVKEPSRR
jgi:hypothetical protein